MGGNQLNITPATNSAADVVTAINSAYGGQVRASVVDLGTGNNHDYRIAMQSTTAGPINGSMTLDLQNGARPIPPDATDRRHQPYDHRLERRARRRRQP